MDQHNENNYYLHTDLPNLTGSSYSIYTLSGESYNNFWKVDYFEESDWQCEMFGCGESLILKPRKGKEPNFFWRWMQYICFGNKWKKK